MKDGHTYPRLAVLCTAGALTLTMASSTVAQQTQPPAPEASSPSWWQYGLETIGGVEVATTVGQAQIEAIDSGDQVVAEGSAAQDSISVSLYAPPKESGWELGPSFGFVSHTVTIADFDQILPQNAQSQGVTVGAVCSDPDSGQPQPCRGINAYKLKLRSISAGIEGGYHYVLQRKGSAYQPFVSFIAGVKAIEHRTATLTINPQSKGTLRRLAYFEAAHLSASAGLSWPQYHMALRILLSHEIYADFDLKTPAEFAGDVICDPELGRCSRQRVFVDQTGMSITGVSLALSAFY